MNNENQVEITTKAMPARVHDAAVLKQAFLQTKEQTIKRVMAISGWSSRARAHFFVERWLTLSGFERKPAVLREFPADPPEWTAEHEHEARAHLARQRAEPLRVQLGIGMSPKPRTESSGPRPPGFIHGIGQAPLGFPPERWRAGLIYEALVALWGELDRYNRAVSSRDKEIEETEKRLARLKAGMETA